jgi:hypothetical protein
MDPTKMGPQQVHSVNKTRHIPELPRRRAAPAGYEMYDIDWEKLNATETAIVCAFADALREIRRNDCV